MERGENLLVQVARRRKWVRSVESLKEACRLAANSGITFGPSQRTDLKRISST